MDSVQRALDMVALEHGAGSYPIRVRLRHTENPHHVPRGVFQDDLRHELRTRQLSPRHWRTWAGS